MQSSVTDLAASTIKFTKNIHKASFVESKKNNNFSNNLNHQQKKNNKSPKRNRIFSVFIYMNISHCEQGKLFIVLYYYNIVYVHLE